MRVLKLSFIAILAMFVLFSCSDDDEMTPTPFMAESTSFNYSFHNGQTVPSAPYEGIHPTDLSATMMLESMENGNTMITIMLDNTVDGATYAIHAHDAADPANTPNGTPYNETPNGDILAQMLEGNGSTVSVSQEANRAYDELLNDYEGFFVVHDPLQPINTADISTYLVVGGFARTQPNTSFDSQVFNYSFNQGQLSDDFAYSGTHPTNLGASIQVDELADNKSRITIRLMNSIDGETYPTHAHDMADPSTTPNGTPYNETPNADVFAGGIEGNGGMTGLSNITEMSYSDITAQYEGFFVVHDPLQPVDTADPTTYVVLGVFAR